MPEIDVPANGWRPRMHQRKAWVAREQGIRFRHLTWHRRAGKDEIALHGAAVESFRRVGNRWHMLPEAAQARKAIWDAVNPHSGRKRIDEAFPVEIRRRTRDQEMAIEFVNGSTWQVVGSDNFDSLVGSAPVGVVFSEYALANPRAWAMIRPILLENQGTADFISTPRGPNHHKSLYDAHVHDPDWFVERLSAEKTNVFTPEALLHERRDLIAEYGDDVGDAMYRQEYLCDWHAAVMGSYYGSMIEAAEGEGRIGRVPYDPSLPVHTAWDLGIGDSTAIWLAQVQRMEVRLIDYIESSGVGLDWYVGKLRERPYAWGQHYLPHDGNARELGTGKTRVETLRSLGLTDVRVLSQQRLEDGINAVRLMLPRMWADRDKCARGIECLRMYRREWDDERKVYADKPLHDWSSHGSDAARYLALALRQMQPGLTDSKARGDGYSRGNRPRSWRAA